MSLIALIGDAEKIRSHQIFRLFFEERGKPRHLGKNLSSAERSREENRQTQPTKHAKSGIDSSALFGVCNSGRAESPKGERLYNSGRPESLKKDWLF